MVAEFGRDILQPLLQRTLIGKEQAIGPAQRMDLLAVEAAPLQPDDVEAGQMGPVADAPCHRE